MHDMKEAALPNPQLIIDTTSWEKNVDVERKASYTFPFKGN